MKIHVITIGEPKLSYAIAGCQEYLGRLKHYHQITVTHLADKWAYDSRKILDTAGQAYKIALVIDGPRYTSLELADKVDHYAQNHREICILLGGPEGLPSEVIAASQEKLSFSPLTFPHDLAMVVLFESLYRASTINAGLPYHK